MRDAFTAPTPQPSNAEQKSRMAPVIQKNHHAKESKNALFTKTLEVKSSTGTQSGAGWLPGASRRLPSLVQGSPPTVWRFLKPFEQGSPHFTSYWALWIIQAALTKQDSVYGGESVAIGTLSPGI